MIPRALAPVLRKAAARYPAVTVTGPRQSGKTTLVRSVFGRYAYVSLEAPDDRAFALEDPRGFLAQFKKPVVLDEVQRTPDLFSYIQTIVDEKNRPGQFILTGSQNFLLMERVAQSLAGRCAVLHLLPFSLTELGRRRPRPPERLAGALPRRLSTPSADLWTTLFSGFYPRIHDKKLPPHDWLANYVQTYVERDVRQMLAVGDLESFHRFLRLCAGRSGQILNLSGLASDCGIAHMTAQRWLSVLEASFLVLLLRPYHRNFGKRMIKSPKLHFLDPGLLCYLLQIRAPADLPAHASRGAIFESFVVSELAKGFTHRGEQPRLFFWRDSQGHEVDVLVELSDGLLPIEIKSGQTVAEDAFDNLHFWRGLAGASAKDAALVYGGTRHYKRSGVNVVPWFGL